MTWEQAVATVLAIGVTALARVVNMYLPPVIKQGGHEVAPAAGGVDQSTYGVDDVSSPIERPDHTE